MRYLLLTIVFVAGAMAARAQKSGGLLLTSAFINNDTIPTRYTCDGENINPPIEIANIPPGTKSFAIIVHDADADTLGGYTHWVVWDILPDNKITENYKGSKQGNNSAGSRGYVGMCPRVDNHHYSFKVYALDMPRLRIPPDADKKLLESAMMEHILAAGEIVGLYQRKPKK